MYNARSITLEAKYRTTPYSPQAQASAEAGASAAATETPASAQAVAAVAAGTTITLNKTPLYVSSTATSPAAHKTGTYYIYDGILIKGRYRITNTPARCGKKPVGKNVTGWVDAEEIGLAKTPQTQEATTQEIAPVAEPVSETPETDITEFVESMTYTDNAADNSDSIDLTVDAQDERWLNEWLPQKGSTMRATAKGHDWDKEGDERVMECGLFVVDDVNFSDTPSTLQVGGVARPSDTNFSTLDRTTTWKNTTIKRIGETLAKRYGLGFTFDGEDQDIECEEQDDPDGTFYNDLCKAYGLTLKIYARRLWVYDREAYKAKPPVATIDRTDISRGSFSWTTTLSGTYTGGTWDYTDPDKDTDLSCSIGTGPRIKGVSSRATSVHDASVKLCAELNNANHGMITAKFSTPGWWNISAANTIMLTGYGIGAAGGEAISGKYFVDKVTHKFTKTGGFTTEWECSAVKEGFHHWDVGGSIQHNGGSKKKSYSGSSGGSSASAPTYTSAYATTSPAANAENAATGLKAGDFMILQDAPYYASGTSTVAAGKKSGFYYIYDGVLVNGRYRICAKKERCGKKPIGHNISGYVPKQYCKKSGE